MKKHTCQIHVQRDSKNPLSNEPCGRLARWLHRGKYVCGLHRKPQTLEEKVVDAEARASKWLADANEQNEAGNKNKAEEFYDKAQYWLDLMNKYRGNR